MPGTGWIPQFSPVPERGNERPGTVALHGSVTTRRFLRVRGDKSMAVSAFLGVHVGLAGGWSRDDGWVFVVVLTSDECKRPSLRGYDPRPYKLIQTRESEGRKKVFRKHVGWRHLISLPSQRRDGQTCGAAPARVDSDPAFISSPSPSGLAGQAFGRPIHVGVVIIRWSCDVLFTCHVALTTPFCRTIINSH
jgi:hypothetical protein